MISLSLDCVPHVRVFCSFIRHLYREEWAGLETVSFEKVLSFVCERFIMIQEESGVAFCLEPFII